MLLDQYKKITEQKWEEILEADSRIRKDIVEAGYGVVYEHRRMLINEVERLRSEIKNLLK